MTYNDTAIAEIDKHACAIYLCYKDAKDDFKMKQSVKICVQK